MSKREAALSKAKADISSAKAELQSVRQQLKDYAKGFYDAFEQTGKAKESEEKIQRAYEDLASVAAKQEKEIERQSLLRERAEFALEEAETQLQDQNRKVLELENALKESEAKQNHSKEVAKRFAEAIAFETEQKQKLQREVIAQRKELEKVQKDLSDQSVNLISSLSTIQGLQSEIETRNRQVSELEARLSIAESQGNTEIVESLQQQIEGLNQANKTMGAELAQRAKEIRSLRVENAKMLKDQDDRIAAKDKDLEKISKDLEKATSQVNSMRDALLAFPIPNPGGYVKLPGGGRLVDPATGKPYSVDKGKNKDRETISRQLAEENPEKASRSIRQSIANAETWRDIAENQPPPKQGGAVQKKNRGKP